MQGLCGGEDLTEAGLRNGLSYRDSQHKTTASLCKTAHHLQHALLCKKRWTHCWDCKVGRKEAPGLNAVSRHTSLIGRIRLIPANSEFLPHNCTNCPTQSSSCFVCCPLRPGWLQFKFCCQRPASFVLGCHHLALFVRVCSGFSVFLPS